MTQKKTIDTKYILISISILTLILFFSFLYIVLKTFDKNTIKALSRVNLKFLLIAFLFSFLGQTFDMLRVRTLSKALNVNYSIIYGYAISFVNTFASSITPAHIGGEMASIYMLGRKGSHFHKSMSIITMKALTGLSFFILALPFTIFYLTQKPYLFIKLFKLLLAVVLIAYIIFFISKKVFHSNFIEAKRKTLIKNIIKRYLASLRIYKKRKKSSIFLAILYAVLFYLSILFVAPFLLMSFNSKNIEPLDIVLKQLTLFYAIYLSPTPGGSGVGEIGGLEIFKDFLRRDEIGLFVIVWRFITQYISAFIGFFTFEFFIIKDGKNKAFK